MRSALVLGLIVSAVSVASSSAAQVPYSVTHGSETYTPFSGGTVHPLVAYGAFPVMDEGVATVALPFAFNWYGVSHSTIYVYTNGFLSFSPPTTMGIIGPPSVVPSPVNVIHDFIGVVWANLVGGPNAAIQSRVSGTVGARIFELQFSGFEREGSPAPSSAVSFQVRLYEGSNTLQLAYGPMFGIVSATAAIENVDGTQGENLMEASASCVGSCVCALRQCDSINFGGMGGRTITIDLPNQAEVQGTVSAAPGAFAGANFDAQITVLNAGLAPAAPFAYALMLSPSNTSTVGSVTLQSFTAPTGLAALDSFSATVPLTVPPGTMVGDYYIALVVDTTYQVNEVSEANNAAFSGLFRTGPELTGEVSGPAETGPNEPFDVQLNLRSDGAPVSAPVRVQFYLSASGAVDASAVLVPPAQFISLPDGFATTQTLTLVTPAAVPPSPPNYYLVAVVDDGDTILETDETNNVLVSPATIEVRGADLEVTSFEGEDFAFRGLPYPLTTVISNAGAASARDFTVCAVMSTSLPITVGSIPRLIETAPLTLAPGASMTLRLQPIVPANTAPGLWHVAAIVDCAGVVAESSETNNLGARANPVTVMDPAPDFVALELSAAPNAVAGETLAVSVKPANLGTAPGDALVRVLLSDNPGVTAQDRLILQSSGALTLAPSADLTVSGWAELPGDLPTGNYYLGAVVDPDNQVSEVREDNNTQVIGPLLVVGADLAIVSPEPPHPVIGNPYAWRFAAAGGSAAYTWTGTWDNGPAPMGLSFDPQTAELTGTPAAEAQGSHTFTVRVTSGSLSVESTYQLLISQPTLPLTVVTSRLPPGVATEPYSVQLVAVGGVPPYLWALGSPGPAGVSVAQDGELGGEPQLVGPSNFTVVVRDQLGQRATGRLSLDVVDPSASITISTADIPSGVVGQDYQTAFNAVGGMQPYTWILNGALAPGLNFMSSTAQLTGTPTVAGSYEIIVEVRDSMGLLDRNAYVLEIFEEGALRIMTGTEEDDRLPDGEVGQVYLRDDGAAAQLIATPAGGVRWMLANGILPPGLSLDGQTGVISGTPSRQGAFAFTVLATNEANDFRRRALVISVAPEGGDKPPVVGSGSCRCVNAGQPASGMTLLFGLGLWAMAFVRRDRRSSSAEN